MKEIGLMAGIIVYGLGFFTMTSVGYALMSYHLVHYLLSYYIRLLRFQLIESKHPSLRNNQQDQSEGIMIFPTRLSTRNPFENPNFLTNLSNFFYVLCIYSFREKLASTQQLFNFVCLSTKEWNQLFSFPVLFLLVSRIITTAFCLFAFVQGMFIEEIFMSAPHLVLFVIFVLDCITLSIVFTAPEMPAKEVIHLE